jgi:flagellar secretion chaperone FliS
MNAESAMSAYIATKNESALTDSSPQKLIGLLLDRVLEHLAKAVGAIHRGDAAARGEAVGKAMTIISSLQAYLDYDEGSDIAKNLDRLYDYMNGRLLQASSENSVGHLNEVSGLLHEIKAGWDAIPAELTHTPK